MNDIKQFKTHGGLPILVSGIVFWGLTLVGILIISFIITDKMQNMHDTQALNAQLFRAELEHQLKFSDQSFNYSAPDSTLTEWIKKRLTELNFSAMTLNNNKQPGLQILEPDVNAEQYPLPISVNQKQDQTTKNITLTLYTNDMQQLTAQLRNKLILTMGLILLCFAFVLQLILNKVLRHPILDMINVAQQFKDGDESVRFNEARTDELGYMAKFTNAALDSVLSSKNKTQQALKQLNENQLALQKHHDSLEEQIEIKTQALLNANKELEAYSYSIAHDLRQPLRSLDGFSLILLEDYMDQLDEEGCSYLTRIRTASQRMSVLIDEILALTKINRMEVRYKSIDLSAMSKEIGEQLKYNSKQHDTEFVIHTGIEGQGDPALLRIIMENLLGNAWKYSSKEKRPRIEFSQYKVNGTNIYRIDDNGIGFDESYSEKLFKPFSRLHSDKSFEGTGIGLATVERAVKRMNGKVWASSVPGKGATFYFTINSNATITSQTHHLNEGTH